MTLLTAVARHAQAINTCTAAGNRRRMAGDRGDRRPLLDDGEAFAVAELLDELAGVYHGEPLGDLAREMAVRLNDRRGI